jgi:PAS domain S-box-containing protein
MVRWQASRSLVTRMVVAFCLGGLTLSAVLGVFEYRDAESRASASVGQQVLVSLRNLQDVLHEMMRDGEPDGVASVLKIFAQDPRLVAIRFTAEGAFRSTAGPWPEDLTDAAVWTVDDHGVTGFGRLDLSRQTVLALPFRHGEARCVIEAIIDGPYLERHVRRDALRQVAAQWLMLAVMTLVGLLLLRRWFTGPLMRLVALASADAGSDAFQQAGREMSGEFRELAAAVSRMLARLDDMTEALRGRERAFEDLYQSAPSALLSIDGTGRVTNANRQAAELFGVDKATTLHGRSMLDYVVARDRALFRQSVDRLAVDRACRCEMQLVFDDGRTIDAAAMFTGVYNDENKLDRVRWRSATSARPSGCSARSPSTST